MSGGIYTAASGGLYALRKLEVVSNNLANVDTVGFKAQRLVSRQQEFSDTLAQQIEGSRARPNEVDRTPGVVDIETVTDFSPGPVNETGNPLNVALMHSNQFFAVQTPDGEAFTRAGNFRLNGEGTLVTPDGMAVLGEGGPIAIPPDGMPSISGNGTVSVDGQQIGQIRVVEFEELRDLERTEGVRFRVVEGGSAGQNVETPDMIPGALEMPNVSPVSAVVEMIDAQRSFEAYTKLVREIDTLNETALRQLR